MDFLEDRLNQLSSTTPTSEYFKQPSATSVRKRAAQAKQKKRSAIAVAVFALILGGVGIQRSNQNTEFKIRTADSPTSTDGTQTTDNTALFNDGCVQSKKLVSGTGALSLNSVDIIVCVQDDAFGIPDQIIDIETESKPYKKMVTSSDGRVLFGPLTQLDRTEDTSSSVFPTSLKAGEVRIDIADSIVSDSQACSNGSDFAQNTFTYSDKTYLWDTEISFSFFVDSAQREAGDPPPGFLKKIEYSSHYDAEGKRIIHDSVVSETILDGARIFRDETTIYIIIDASDYDQNAC